jgi:hypothetical protein
LASCLSEAAPSTTIPGIRILPTTTKRNRKTKAIEDTRTSSARGGQLYVGRFPFALSPTQIVRLPAVDRRNCD